MKLGCYFYGYDIGIDCSCCGDRWSLPTESSFISLEEKSKFYKKEFKNIEDYIQHYADTLIYTWAKPYARIFYLDGSKKEIFIKNKVF